MATSASPIGSQSDSPDDGLSKTEIFEILGNDRRRHALHYLLSIEEGTDIRELSRRIAAWENDEPLEEVTSSERRRVYVSLHQTHLPRMDEAGILNYESSSDVIRLTDRGEELRVYMEVVEGNDIPWSEFYLGLSAFSAALLAAVWIQAPPFDLLGPLTWGAVIVALFTAASVVHVYHNKQNRIGNDGEPPGMA